MPHDKDPRAFTLVEEEEEDDVSSSCESEFVIPRATAFHLCVDVFEIKNATKHPVMICPDAAETFLRFLADLIEMEVISSLSHKFTQREGHKAVAQGVSVVLLLALSHSSIHTNPQNGTANFDIFSCKMFDSEPVINAISYLFKRGGTVGSFSNLRIS